MLPVPAWGSWWVRSHLCVPKQETSRPAMQAPFSFLLWVSRTASQDSHGQRKHTPLSGQIHLPLRSPVELEVPAKLPAGATENRRYLFPKSLGPQA